MGIKKEINYYIKFLLKEKMNKNIYLISNDISDNEFKVLEEPLKELNKLNVYFKYKYLI